MSEETQEPSDRSECDPELKRHGVTVCTFHTSAKLAEDWVRMVAAFAGARVDWGHSYGYCVVRCFEYDYGRVRRTIRNCLPFLKASRFRWEPRQSAWQRFCYRLGRRVGRLWPLAALGLLACATEAPKPRPARSADPVTESMSEEIRDIGRTMAESSATMAQASRLIDQSIKQRQRIMQTIVIERGTMKGKRLDKFREICHRENGDVIFRGGARPFVCMGREPDCEEFEVPDAGPDAGLLTQCSESVPHFVVYQVAPESLY